MRHHFFTRELRFLSLICCGALLACGTAKAADQPYIQFLFSYPSQDVPPELRNLQITASDGATVQPSSPGQSQGVVVTFPTSNSPLVRGDFNPTTQLQGSITIANGPNTLVLTNMYVIWAFDPLSFPTTAEPTFGNIYGYGSGAGFEVASIRNGVLNFSRTESRTTRTSALSITELSTCTTTWQITSGYPASQFPTRSSGLSFTDRASTVSIDQLDYRIAAQ